MRVRFKRDVRRSAGGTIACGFKRDRFSVRYAVEKVRTLARDVAIRCDDNAADKRARTYAADAFRRAFLGPAASATLDYEAGIDAALDGLAAHLERHLDLDALLALARPPRRG